MRILIIRHGDPNYEIDGLTPRGELEAEALAKRLVKENISAVYCSTLGRARLTAQPTLDALGIKAEYCEWLREFNYERVTLPYSDEKLVCWDLLPEFVNTCENLYSPTKWFTESFLVGTDIKKNFDNVVGELDAVIARHGYERVGYNYKAVRPNHDTIAIFCHYGVTSVLLAHLMNCSPYTFWQNAVTLTSSVTLIHTEERRDGMASMRAAAISDTSHLYAAGLEPSFSARFCECYTDDTRHD